MFGYRLDSPYALGALRSALRAREVLMCFVPPSVERVWNSACHVTVPDRLQELLRDHGNTVEFYAVELGKLRGEFDWPIKT